MMSPKVSVIVPCYNQAVYLADCLQSVLSQTYLNWECIIVDDGSPDNTEEIAGIWCARDSRFKYLKKPNGGLSSARNAGINFASGEYILPLDADDYIGNTYLEKAIDVFIRDPDTSLVYCQARLFGFDNGDWELPAFNFKDLLRLNLIFCSALYSKKDFLTYGPYDEEIKSGWEDWSLWVSILKSDSKVVRIDEVLFFYRTKAQSMVRNMEDKDKELARWNIFMKNWQKYKEFYPAPVTLINENLVLRSQVERLNPKVSVVVSCRNEGAYLKECLVSVQKQTYHNLECIIVNDGSTDDTEEIAREWSWRDPRFRHLKKEMSGFGAALNAGIRVADGSYILPLDATDYISKDYLEKAIRRIKDHDNVKLVYGRAKYLGESEGWGYHDRYSYKRLQEQDIIPYCSLFRRRDYLLTSGYNENTQGGNESWAFWLQLLRKEDKVVRLKEVVLYIRNNRGSMTRTASWLTWPVRKFWALVAIN